MSDPYGMDDALAEVEAENPLFYTFEGEDFPCIRGDINFLKNLAYGGYAPETTATLVVRVSQLPNPRPELKSDIYWEGKHLHLETALKDPNGIFEVWGLDDPTKGM